MDVTTLHHLTTSPPHPTANVDFAALTNVVLYAHANYTGASRVEDVPDHDAHVAGNALQAILEDGFMMSSQPHSRVYERSDHGLGDTMTRLTW